MFDKQPGSKRLYGKLYDVVSNPGHRDPSSLSSGLKEIGGGTVKLRNLRDRN